MKFKSLKNTSLI